MNRKGQVQDLVVFLITLFTIAIFASILYKIGGAIQTGLVMLGLFLVLTISAVLVPTNIIYTTLFLAIGALLWFISIPLSNAYSQFASSGAMAGIASDMPLTYTIMTQLPIFATITLVLLIVILYGKRFLFTEGGL